MSAWMHKLISPKHCARLIARYQPLIAVLCFIATSYGLWGGLIAAPSDYQQGNLYRIMYCHVPLAILSLTVYVVMSAAAFCFLIWKIKIANSIAKISAPIGAVFTALTLITGAIWGKPTWGTWWIWDARLTAEFILLFIYIGIIAIRQAMPEPRLAAHASAVVILLGLVNIPIVHYSVDWWNTLHQGPSILKLSAPSIASSMLYPLLSMIVAGFLYYILLLMMGLKKEWA